MLYLRVSLPLSLHATQDQHVLGRPAFLPPAEHADRALPQRGRVCPSDIPHRYAIKRRGSEVPRKCYQETACALLLLRHAAASGTARHGGKSTRHSAMHFCSP